MRERRGMRGLRQGQEVPASSCAHLLASVSLPGPGPCAPGPCLCVRPQCPPYGVERPLVGSHLEQPERGVPGGEEGSGPLLPPHEGGLLADPWCCRCFGVGVGRRVRGQLRSMQEVCGETEAGGSICGVRGADSCTPRCRPASATFGDLKAAPGRTAPKPSSGAAKSHEAPGRGDQEPSVPN